MADSKSVVVLLADESRANVLCSLLAAEGCDVRLAASSDQLRKFGNEHRVDCLIIEHDLPGFLTGLEIVERLRQELLNPLVILVGDFTARELAIIRELRIDHTLPPNARLEMIRDSLKASLTVSAATTLRIPLRARQIAESSDCFTPLPQLVLKVMSQLGGNDGDLAELAHDLSADARLTAELLRITNSTSFGLRQKVRRVFDAVNFLGYRRTVSLVIAIAQKGMQRDAQRSLPDWFKPWFQLRSVLSASAGYAFAERHLRGSGESAYVLGLLQDLGILTLAHSIGPRYLQLVERCRRIGQLQLIVGEQQQFGVDHAEVGAALLQKWAVPIPIIRHVLYHHQHDPTEPMTELEVRLTEVLRFAEGLTDMRDAPSPQRQRRLAQLAEPFSGLKSDSCKSCLAQAIAKTAEFEDLFQMPIPPAGELEDFVRSIDMQDWESDAHSDGAADDIPLESGSNSTILVVEDDPKMAAVIELMLREQRMQVLHASSAEEASFMIERCHGVLCEVHLKGHSGLDFIEAVRRRGFAGTVVMMSDDRSRTTVRRSVETGANGYLVKPINKADLQRTLERCQLLPLIDSVRA